MSVRPRVSKTEAHKDPRQLSRVHLFGLRALAVLWLVAGLLFVGRAIYFISTDAVSQREELIYIFASSLLMGPLCFTAGLGIILSRSWGPGFGLLVSALSILNFPLGTVLGGYGFYACWHVLSRTDSNRPWRAA